jgi:hypothetical protein
MQTSIHQQNVKVKTADGTNIYGRNVEWDKKSTEKTLNVTEGQKNITLNKEKRRKDENGQKY